MLADLARLVHVLIAGTTGSGKSQCINGLITSILLRATPDDVRLILIDPKKVELSHFDGIPHLLAPVVTQHKMASAVLTNVVHEMERRYEFMLRTDNAQKIKDLNRKLVRMGEKPLPYIVVVIDELADLMMVAPAEVEHAVIRLGQMGRAVGIHMVVATQRPSVDVVTGLIKTNVPSRIAFAVSSQTDSRVILDSGGAESLLGEGDMLFHPYTSAKMLRVQGVMVSPEEMKLVTEHWRLQAAPSSTRSCSKALPRRAVTAPREQTKTNCSRRPSRPWCAPAPRLWRSFSAACGSAMRAPGGSSTSWRARASSPATTAARHARADRRTRPGALQRGAFGGCGGGRHRGDRRAVSRRSLPGRPGGRRIRLKGRAGAAQIAFVAARP